MTTSPALVVPVDLDVLVVNRALQGRDAFRSWQHTYLALDDYLSPEPDGGDRQSNDPVHSHTGVHLHWTLPRGLRHGVQDPATGEIRYPLVPNRWLVIRVSGTGTRLARAWVIESDCPYSPRAQDDGHDLARSSPYLVDATILRAWQASPDPYRNTMDPDVGQVQIGLAFGHTDTPWTERSGRDPLFLTAMASGDPYFTTYTPHNTNVFSFLDDLSDLTSATTLGYRVIGWYSDPAADVLASRPPGASYADQLAHLGWQDPRLTGEADHDGAVSPVTRSLYAGTALTIGWDPAASAAPVPDPLDTIQDNGALSIALGNTTEDAFTALAGQALHATGAAPTAADVALLRAFLHDLLTVAEEKGGDERVRRQVHDASFAASAGGHRWTVTPPPADPSSADPSSGGSPSAGSASAEAAAPRPFVPPAWLATLNDDQRQLDERLGELRDLQWRLNALWLKNGIAGASMFPPDDVPDQDLMVRELDAEQEGSLAHTLRLRTAQVRELAAKVPQPDHTQPHANAHDAFLAGVGAFAAAKGLGGGAELKAVPRPPYAQSNNPVVSLSGILPPADATVPDQPLPVRPLTADGAALISAVTVAGTTITAVPGRGPVPAVAGLDAFPPEVPGLFAEYFLLDPGNAAALAAAAGLPSEQVAAVLGAHPPAAYIGTLPGLGLEAWTQPWEPLFMEWKISYRHIPHTVGGRRCWTFDGTDYRFTPQGLDIPLDRVTVTGVCALGPHPRSLFAARLKEYIAQHGTDDQRDQLDVWLAAIGDWGLLAQELTGFNDRLAARDLRAFRRPTTDDADFPDVAGLVGYPDAATEDGLPARYRGRVSTVPYLPGSASAPFHETRQGQICVEELFLYDKFGRVLDVVSADTQSGGLHDYRNFPLTVDTALAARTSLTPTIASVAQLPPRPLQPARLDFDLLDAQTGTRIVGTAADPSPIRGWILPNHLDHSLLLYDPAGLLLGTFRLLTGADGRRTGQWEPPPGSALSTPDQLAAHAPEIAALIGSPKLAAEANVTAFLDVIDSTLWTTDPLGRRADQNLSLLLGRPLALVRAQLRLTLEAPPIRDTGWAATLDPPPPAFTSDQFEIRLGDVAARDDGLIGYYTTDPHGAYDYDRFHSVTAPDDQQDYTTQIGPPGAASAGAAPAGTVSAGSYVSLTFGDPAPTRLLLLLDPRAPVHATSGITPTATVTVPPQHTDDALRHLQALFRFGPVLTTEHASNSPPGSDPDPDPDPGSDPGPDPGSGSGILAFPRPAERNGSWSWLRPAPGEAPWVPYALVPAPLEARFPDSTVLLEDGLLRFLTDPEQ
ncbi:conserved hypothetical protein [Frankia sp. AiPs1]|uniref:CHAD domain-containing protein n=1 Tax=Frankia sp. AiPa1 TaxID=573492 RepID=UPI00202AE903|nr:CHAD domain-containing protein [Frankia sp. AiPa1]MCL9758152.1 CHAD domain-containing protein [Frankia sp. AiPa1]